MVTSAGDDVRHLQRRVPWQVNLGTGRHSARASPCSDRLRVFPHRMTGCGREQEDFIDACPTRGVRRGNPDYDGRDSRVERFGVEDVAGGTSTVRWCARTGHVELCRRERTVRWQGLRAHHRSAAPPRLPTRRPSPDGWSSRARAGRRAPDAAGSGRAASCGRRARNEDRLWPANAELTIVAVRSGLHRFAGPRAGLLAFEAPELRSEPDCSVSRMPAAVDRG